MTISVTAAVATPFPLEPVREPSPCSYATPRGNSNNNSAIRSSQNPYDFVPEPPRGRRGPIPATTIRTAPGGDSSVPIVRPKKPLSDRLFLDLDAPRQANHFVPPFRAPISGSTSDSSTQKSHRTHNRNQQLSSSSSELPPLGVSWIKMRNKRSLERRTRLLEFETSFEPYPAIKSVTNASTKTEAAASLQRRLFETASSLVSKQNKEAPLPLQQMPFSTNAQMVSLLSPSVSSPISDFYKSNKKVNRIVSPQRKREDERVAIETVTGTEKSPDQKIESKKNNVACCA